MNINEECLTHASLDGKAMFNNVYIAGSDFNIENYIDKYSNNLNTIQRKIESVLFGANIESGKHMGRTSFVVNTKKNNKLTNSVEKRNNSNLSPIGKKANNASKFMIASSTNFQSPNKKNSLIPIEFAKSNQANNLSNKLSTENLRDSPKGRNLLSLHISPLTNGYGIYGKKDIKNIVSNNEKKNHISKKDRKSNSIAYTKDLLKNFNFNKNKDITENNDDRINKYNEMSAKNSNKFKNKTEEEKKYSEINAQAQSTNRTLNMQKTLSNFLDKKSSNLQNENNQEKKNLNNTKNEDILVKKENSFNYMDNLVSLSKLTRTDTLDSNNSKQKTIENLDNSNIEIKEKMNFLSGNPIKSPLRSKINFFTNSTKQILSDKETLKNTTLNNKFLIAQNNNSNSNSTKNVSDFHRTTNKLSMPSIKQEQNTIDFIQKANKNSSIPSIKSLPSDIITPIKHAFSSMNLKNSNKDLSKILQSNNNENETEYTNKLSNYLNTNYINSNDDYSSETSRSNTYNNTKINLTNNNNIHNHYKTNSVFNYSNQKQNLAMKTIKLTGLHDNASALSTERKHYEVNHIKAKSPFNIQYDSTLNFFDLNNENDNNHFNNIANNCINNNYDNYQTEDLDNNTIENSTDICNSELNIENLRNKPVEFVKEAFPQLLENIINLQKESKGIRKKMKKTVEKDNKELEKSPLKTQNQKYFKEKFDFELNLNDVFLYGTNGEGYYMNNEKVFKEAKMLKKIQCENILKHKKFFSKRFELKKPKKPEYPSGADDGLSFLAVQNFKKVSECLDETENLKKKNIKEINKFKSKLLEKIDEI